MPYIPHAEADIDALLKTLNVDSIDDLFDEIPPELRSGQLNRTPSGASEMEVTRIMAECAQRDQYDLCFIGAGAYEHHIPAAVWDLVGRGEFMTAYTPYQAEASQGTLQMIYEYQSIMAHLTAMDVSNASLYDGASALAEAVLMAVRANRKSKSRRVLMPKSVHPLYRKACDAIVGPQQIECVDVDFDADSATTPLELLKAYEGEDIAALVIPQPSFFGTLEAVDELTDWAHAQGALVIAVVNPTALALLKAPGEWGADGADIAVGEGQPLGIPMSSGGPYFGFMCCQQKIVRQMPGRIIGGTVDVEGRRGFTLTLQAREQHIRRSKATSNICTNQGLAMAAATIYTSLLGSEGLQRVAQSSHSNLQTLKAALSGIDGVEIAHTGPHFHEAVVRLPKDAVEVIEVLADQGIQAGYPLGEYFADHPELANTMLVCTTETKTPSDIERFAAALSEALQR